MLIGCAVREAIAQTTGAAVDDAIRDLERRAGRSLGVKRSSVTGLATFVGASPAFPVALIPLAASTAVRLSACGDPTRFA
jgi:hypothetical protein